MSFASLNDTLQQIEQKAKNELSKLRKDEIDGLAKAYRKRIIKTNIIFAIFSTIAYIVFFFCLPLITEGEPIGAGLIAFMIIIAIFTIGLFPILMLIDIRKPNDELALRAIKKDLNANSPIMKPTLNENFTFSKECLILANGWSTTKLLIDNDNKTFVYQKGKTYSKVYNFKDIINYEVYENGKSKVQGRAGSALIGGAFFGLGGLIVGSSMSRDVDEKCNQLKLFIRLNDIDCPQIVIVYVDNVEWDKSGWTYRNMKENLQSVCSVLEFMMNNKTLELSETKESKPSKTKKEQLQELKEMLDDGLITQEDFDIKKRQILEI